MNFKINDIVMITSNSKLHSPSPIYNLFIITEVSNINLYKLKAINDNYETITTSNNFKKATNEWREYQLNKLLN